MTLATTDDDSVGKSIIEDCQFSGSKTQNRSFTNLSDKGKVGLNLQVRNMCYKRMRGLGVMLVYFVIKYKK